MYDYAIIWDWLAFAVRWLHVITAIAWIGSSFYFVAMDLGLRKHANLPKGAYGEEWQVHGGGFYHIQKYLVAPEAMPEHLTWFKWEAYSTWLSGAALLAIVYWAGGEIFLIDRTKADLQLWQAVLVSAGSLTIGWIVYDLLCKSKLGHSPTTLMVLLFVLLVIMGYGYNQIFTGRAMMLHLGAFTATIMSANVFFIIIPNQKKVVAALKAGEKPDPALGKQAKQRSLHNNYLTLPVLFFMLSNHYPLAFATQYNWVIAALVFLIGVLIRHFFNSMHGRKGKPYWTFVAAAVIFAIIAWLSSFGATVAEDRYEAAVPAGQMAYVNSPHFETVRDTVLGRCSMCHAAEPVWEGIHVAPKNVMLDTDATIVAHAREIFLQAGASHAMPPGNVTEITPDERALIVAWFREAQ